MADSFEYEVYREGGFIPQIDFEDEKKARNRAAQRKYRRKIQKSPIGASNSRQGHHQHSAGEYEDTGERHNAGPPSRIFSHIETIVESTFPSQAGSAISASPLSNFQSDPSAPWDQSRADLEFLPSSVAYCTNSGSFQQGQPTPPMTPEDNVLFSPVSRYMVSPGPVVPESNASHSQKFSFYQGSHDFEDYPAAKILQPESSMDRSERSHRSSYLSGKLGSCSEDSGHIPYVAKGKETSSNLRPSRPKSSKSYPEEGKKKDREKGKSNKTSKQRKHLKKEVEKMVGGIDQIYDLGVGLGLCAQDPDFKNILQETRNRFDSLLDTDRSQGSCHESDSSREGH